MTWCNWILFTLLMCLGASGPVLLGVLWVLRKFKYID